MDETEEGRIKAFRPRARIMKTLGEELISSDTVAIIELVKNSYDADARSVIIKFGGDLQVGSGWVEVSDNGVGMDLPTIRSAWMEPATPTKKRNPNSPDGSRRVLGEKGVGRFAASRLASSLELISRKRGSDSESYAFFDWTQFDDEDKYLDEIVIETQQRRPAVVRDNCEGLAPDFFRSEDGVGGTVLRMQGLKNAWSEMSFLALQRGLSRLVSPFSEVDGFDIEISAPAPFEKFSKKIEPPQAVKYPHYTVSGSVMADGEFCLTYTVLATGNPIVLKGYLAPIDDGRWELVDESLVIKKGDFRAPACGELNIQLRIWDRDDLGNIVQMIKSSISNVRKDLDAFAGVNIYRDGFRVMPYGEPNNDWLRLDLRRVQNPTLRISNNQIFGYVQIAADKNPSLQDQSNREGLRENQAYFDLREIMIAILARMEIYRKQYKKGEKKNPPEKPNGQQPGIFEPLSFAEIKGHLTGQHPSDTTAMALVEKVERDYTNKISEIKNVISRYHGLATLGQLIDRLLHQGRHPLSKIVLYANLGLDGAAKLVKADSSDSFATKALDRFQKVLDQGAVLDGVFKRIEPFGGRRRGRPAQLYLEVLVVNAYEILKDDFVSLGVRFDSPASQTLVSVDSSEMQEILVNLMQNSLYWLKMVPEKSRILAVSVKRNESSAVEIVVADSGPGVPWENRELIFEPYFTTKSDGVGLGLSIVGDIVSDYYGGSFELLDSNPLGGAAFRITLRRRV